MPAADGIKGRTVPAHREPKGWDDPVRCRGAPLPHHGDRTAGDANDIPAHEHTERLVHQLVIRGGRPDRRGARRLLGHRHECGRPLVPSVPQGELGKRSAHRDRWRPLRVRCLGVDVHVDDGQRAVLRAQRPSGGPKGADGDDGAHGYHLSERTRSQLHRSQVPPAPRASTLPETPLG
jgi:hypothetical protein